jgi:hypothetical protein
LRKIIFIFLVFILAAGCSVNRKQRRNKTATGNSLNDNELIQKLVSQNLTGRSFYIQKAEFKISTDQGEISGLGTVKFLMPDKFLIEIKSKAGIEIARIFLSGDSVLVNDRFNKKLYYTSASFLKNKYGLSTSVLPVALGDFVNENKLDSSKIWCKDGKVNIEGGVKNVKINYVIDCELGKSVLTIPEDRINESVLQIRYSDFFRANEINTPAKIQITETKSKTTIEIVIRKIISPWDGTIEFVPGKQYQKIPLL